MKYLKLAIPNALLGTLLWLGTAHATTVTYSYTGADCLPTNSDPDYPYDNSVTNSGFYINYDKGYANESAGDENTPRDALECPIIKHSGFHYIESVTVTIANLAGVDDICYIASGNADGGTDIESEAIGIADNVGTISTALDAHEYDYHWIHCYGLTDGDGIQGFQVTESD